MSKRTAGIAFFAMAAFIFSMRHIGAALFAGLIEQSEWPSNVYTLPVGLGIANIVLGVIYLVWGELEELGLISERVEKSSEPAPLLAEIEVESQVEEEEAQTEEFEEEAVTEGDDGMPEEERTEGDEDAVGAGEEVEEDAQAEEPEEEAATEDDEETPEEERAR